MTMRSAGGLVLAALVAGCGVGPDYKRPVTEVPPAFTAPGPPAPPVPTPAAEFPAPGWWRGFGAPDLDRLIETARQNSPDLRAAAARVIQADEAARQAGSPLLPGLSATTNTDWQRTGLGSRNRFAVASPGAFGSRRYYVETRSYSGLLSASYEVDFWGKNRSAADGAAASALASRFDEETVWLTTVTSIATTYFQAIGFRDRREIAERNVRDAEGILEAYRARLDAGTANALDVSQQEALAAGFRAQVPALESSYRQQVIALATLVGVPPEKLSLAPVHLRDLHLPAVSAGLPASVLRRRPDVANAEQLLIAQNFQVRQAVANFFPTLTLTTSGGVSSLALSTITGPGTLLATLSSQVVQTLFDNGARRGQLGQARGRYEELGAQYARTVLQALQDTETALTATSFSAEQERLQADAVRLARRSAEIARAQLAAGTVDQVTVLNTETTLFNDLDALAQVRIARFLNLVSLYKALGGGWSIDQAVAGGG